MKEPNLLAMILKGHLWVESCLNRALDVSLEVPDRLEIDRLPFAAKWNLCLACGAFEASDSRAVRLLNKIRNRLAHDLHSDVVPSDVSALEASLDGPLAHLYATVRRDGDAPVRLRVWFFTVLNWLEFANMRNEYERTNAPALSVFRIATALEERLEQQVGIPRRPIEEAKLEYGVPEPPDPRDAWENYVPDWYE
jgi:hypothetical protein